MNIDPKTNTHLGTKKLPSRSNLTVNKWMLVYHELDGGYYYFLNILFMNM